MSLTANKIMVGVPAGYLSPRLPFPPNPEYNVSVGVEIAPGVGISLDGKALLVGPEGHQGTTEVLGRLEDGTYPQRDTVIVRDGDETEVDGYHTWQDYSLKGKAHNFFAAGDTDQQNFKVSTTDDGLRVGSKYSARAWTVTSTPDGVFVKSDFEDGETFKISTKDGVTTVDSNFDEQDFTITHGAEPTIDGHYAFDDFVLNKTDKGHELKGHYPQQRFLVNYK